ncbi:MAG: hypothetical protein RLY31_1582 [Bacteroidota bacterium]|jgi:predicted nuclease with RNAse H fold
MSPPNTPFFGIDFGAKTAGTTVICLEHQRRLIFLPSAKGQDTDAWLSAEITTRRPAAVYLDAPLSLPGVYRGIGTDHFYRTCDRAVNAMSPMFLGGLTARAMKLRSLFPDIPFFEIYPGHFVRTYLPEAKEYKREGLDRFVARLSERLPLSWQAAPTNWHQVDAAIAWFSGWRHQAGQASCFGRPEEGLIWV